ncbi:bifunctional UDP-N-acetylglucosamine diphosphorylase/glucosamine-1-phosphate N-acetyltransferase GlmU [Metallumcola ferriviriculae]|uniref:Bifunctional protein GlmU n=1 Tax=Metallumcola ferriviriculae TaxID=3039180 RepID=A0AAU0UJY6_9FIRM|nr:bifunctional UDP-N-acetylglucosamine diphosphorylase/glucosamine-1-phosphate N-acetyltransferase GlmU [Desulfitibacteraceae bacterium MK1]
MSDIVAVILAAGKGTRMKSQVAKVLHPLAGIPMALHVLRAVQDAGVKRRIVVVGHQANDVKETLGEEFLYALQEKQLGTGHAVQQTVDLWPQEEGPMLVLCADTPLITAETIKNVVEQHRRSEAVCSVLTAQVPDSHGYGRIIRDDRGYVQKIVEEQDADKREKEIEEINTGCYCFSRNELGVALRRLKPSNAQGEYYLTDVVEFFQQQQMKVAAVELDDYRELQGINNRSQLAEAEKVMRRRINERLMLSGVTMVSPESTYIDVDTKIGEDTLIQPNTRIMGASVIAGGCEIGPDTTIQESIVGGNTTIANSVVKKSRIGVDCTIGPFSYLRPGTELCDGVKIGDFVEVKKSVIGDGTKIPHLTYIGDANIGKRVNVGAGTITCNYDGVNKWKTIIEDGAFIGSSTNLVAPIRISADAIIGAGSTITKDVPANSLAVARGRQKNIEERGRKTNTISKKEKNKEDM